MPKVAKKYYAVRIGREGPRIYDSWPGVSFFLKFSQNEPPFLMLARSNQAKAERQPPILEGRDQTPIETSTPGPSSEGIVLSAEQKDVLRRVGRGENVFFTGSAGTGKSVLLREIIRARGGRGHPGLAITASTGIASVNIGGTTVHSWAGIGLGLEDAKKLGGKFLGQPKFDRVKQRWQCVQTLIIDEGLRYTVIDAIARIVRRSDKPFGGIQTSVSFLQCRIVVRTGSKYHPQFVDMLNAMRFGKLDKASIQAFQSLSRPVGYDDGIGPTQLYPTRSEVDSANQRKLISLPGDGIQYPAADTPGRDSNDNFVSFEQMGRLLERLVAQRVIHLKNMVQGQLVNGSVGQVVRFSTSEEAMQTATPIATEEGLKGGLSTKSELPANYDNSQWPVVRFTCGKEMLCVPTDFTVDNADGGIEARRRQVPLILAWALSVHKSQGQTLERVKVDLGRTFEKGQGKSFLKTYPVRSLSPSQHMLHFLVLLA
ncbi:PIF1-like helicase-domain-containing protein [Suillus subaureus]|uniref:ATP-dependent DNA helicase n=1 Tax=Suillus subaureus TaxID=48587 RepID=A0A9P7JJ19_9AGAM|nr:PIF1-like helicase-domain-containing protein [Suillus subaureus]KAG1825552.1 PIF1-like helicase-domain-containing protein [Suillus subaureus]